MVLQKPCSSVFMEFCVASFLLSTMVLKTDKNYSDFPESLLVTLYLRSGLKPVAFILIELGFMFSLSEILELRKLLG